METKLHATLRGTAAGEEGKALIERCVHCGFCNATCPTYQLLGDELDGPRGRIYLMKQVLEGAEPTARTQLHLDRCLTCRACETTCPSGVEYGRLLDIGRSLVDARVARPPGQRLLRAALRDGLTSRWLPPLVGALRALRPLLPASLRGKLPRVVPAAWSGRLPAAGVPARRMLLLAGCVQPSLLPNVNGATRRVFAAAGIELIEARGAGCCGAIRQHLSDAEGARADARRNIDAWWPAIESGVEAVVMNASGCGAMVREYGHLLHADPEYAARAARVAALTRDAVEILPEALAPLVPAVVGARAAPSVASAAASAPPLRVVFHPPCTLQHAQRIRGAVERLLTAFGADVQPCAEAHLCCGSAGTYSILQPELAGELRARKLANLMATRPAVILSANVGCIAHLGAVAGVPVRHWLEWVDARLAASAVRRA